MLDTKLHTTSHLPLSKQKTLGDYNTIMNRLQKSYTGTDAVLEALSALSNRLKLDMKARRLPAGFDVVDLSRLSQQSVSLSSGAFDLEHRSARIDDSGDLMVCRPAYYLRLAFTFDYFMSTGKYPHEADLPSILRSQHLSIEGSFDHTVLKPANTMPISPVIAPGHNRTSNISGAAEKIRYLTQNDSIVVNKAH